MLLRVRGLQRRERDLQVQIRQLTQELENANSRLEELATQDELTGIPNRRAFNERLDMEWRRAIRRGSVLSLLFLDIDALAPFNSRYGNAEGDGCLILIAQCLKEVSRRPTDLVARFDGGGFVVLLAECELAEAIVYAELLRARVAGLRIPHALSPIGDHITVSVGVSTGRPRAGQSADEFLRAAGKALDAAKEQGRNRVSFEPL
jgi:diguanylate cyclase (GGDEF)-like protein